MSKVLVVALKSWRSAAAAVAVVLGVLIAVSSGCTPLSPCGTGEQEYCSDGDCICGASCTRQSCDDGEVCVGYRYAPVHGVCVEESYLTEHRAYVAPIGEAPADSCAGQASCDAGGTTDGGMDGGIDSEDTASSTSCSLHSECPIGTACNFEGKCGIIECVDCENDPELICLKTETHPQGVCSRPECAADSGCGTGQVCQDGACVDQDG